MDNKLSDIIKTSLENVKDLVDSNTVLGEAVATPNGTYIIPVSKVSVGIATGGLDYKGKAAKEAKEVSKDKNFGGAGGTGVSVTPLAFLVVKSDGAVELLNVTQPTKGKSDDTVDQIVSLIKKSPALIAKIKEFFQSDSDKDSKKKDKKKESKKEEAKKEATTEE